MSDNVRMNQGAGGDLMAADEVTINSESVKVPRIKTGFGVEGSYDGEASNTTPFPVNAYMNSSTMQDGTIQVAPKWAAISISAAADTTIVAAVSSKAIRVLSLTISKLDAGEVQFETTVAGGTALTGLIYLIAKQPYTLPFNPAGWFETIVGGLLNLALTTGTATAGGVLQYIEVE